MKKRTYIEMDDREFDTIVKKAYGLTDYSFGETEECGNDSQHSFSVSKKEPLGDYRRQTIKDIENTKYVPLYCNSDIFQDLVNKDILEPGEYLIKVSW